MSTLIRREQILDEIARCRFVNMQSLAEEHEVSVRTIRRDIEFLSYYYNIYTVSGRYGGVQAGDGLRSTSQRLTVAQVIALSNISSFLHNTSHLCLDTSDLNILDQLIKTSKSSN